MAKRRTIARSYYEPWAARRSIAWESAYKIEPLPPPHLEPAEQRQFIADWHSAKTRAQRQAPWIIWGTNMSPPGACVSLLGKLSTPDSRGIVASIEFSRAWPSGGSNQEEVAKRASECVNAMAGINDPSAFVGAVRSLLGELEASEYDGARVRELLALMPDGDASVAIGAHEH